MTDISLSGRDSRESNPMSFYILAVLVVVAGCAHEPNVELLAATIGKDDHLLSFTTSCADDLSIEVAETNDVVSVSELEGTPIDGDCAGGITVELSAPLGERALVVAGEMWVPLESTCPLGNWGPQNLARHDDC